MRPTTAPRRSEGLDGAVDFGQRPTEPVQGHHHDDSPARVVVQLGCLLGHDLPSLVPGAAVPTPARPDRATPPRWSPAPPRVHASFSTSPGDGISGNGGRTTRRG